jgi:hypothetical protein
MLSNFYIANARTLSPYFPKSEFALLTSSLAAYSNGISFPSTRIFEHLFKILSGAPFIKTHRF